MRAQTLVSTAFALSPARILTCSVTALPTDATASLQDAVVFARRPALRVHLISVARAERRRVAASAHRQSGASQHADSKARKR
eukprot:11427599-Alexandrium_andersonii.AAC.1